MGKRVEVLFRKRRAQTLATMAVLLLAAAVVIGSGASFTATSANPGNVFTAGVLSMSNSKDGAAVLTMDKMRPGDVASGSVTLQNTGDVPGKFSLTKSVVSDADGLGGKLDLVIKRGATTVWSGKLADAMGVVDLGIWAPAESRTYDFTVTWPNDPPESNAEDTALMGKTCTYRFDWNAIADSTIN